MEPNNIEFDQDTYIDGVTFYAMGGDEFHDEMKDRAISIVELHLNGCSPIPLAHVIEKTAKNLRIFIRADIVFDNQSTQDWAVLDIDMDYVDQDCTIYHRIKKASK